MASYPQLCCGPCLPGSDHQPVLPNPPPVVLLSPAAVHRLLLYTARVSLDQVSAGALTPVPEGSGHTACWERLGHWGL